MGEWEEKTMLSRAYPYSHPLRRKMAWPSADFKKATNCQAVAAWVVRWVRAMGVPRCTRWARGRRTSAEPGRRGCHEA
jgi:hypothetical protein